MCLVVIVDDRATNRAIYGQLARNIGQDVEVQAFGEPEQALDWLVSHRADLIVTDYDMPRMVGDEFVSRVRRLPSSNGVPIMMITVCDWRLLRLRALESGATDFLQAPIDHAEFLTRARNLLKLSHAARLPEAAQTTPAPAEPPPSSDESIDDETGALLDRCGEGGYAFHFIEIAPSAEPPDLTEALQTHLRGGDLALKIDGLRYVLLQSHASAAGAEALARRLARARDSFRGVAAFRIGSASPRPEVAPARARAVECLREARRATREAWRVGNGAVAQDNWGLAPIVDLQSGVLAGAQLLNGAAPARADDPDALREALAFVAAKRIGPDDGFRLCLRLTLDSGAAEAMPLRLASLLVEAEVEPARLQFVVCAREAAADRSRAGRILAALSALGVGLAFDLGDAPPPECKAAALALANELEPAASGRPAVAAACRDAGDVAAIAALHAETLSLGDKAPLLLSYDVPESGLLGNLRRAGVRLAQGACFGAPFALRDFAALLAARRRAQGGPVEARHA
jgi:CheY-like chemotaxis protein